MSEAVAGQAWIKQLLEAQENVRDVILMLHEADIPNHPMNQHMTQLEAHRRFIDYLSLLATTRSSIGELWTQDLPNEDNPAKFAIPESPEYPVDPSWTERDSWGEIKHDIRRYLPHQEKTLSLQSIYQNWSHTRKITYSYVDYSETNDGEILRESQQLTLPPDAIIYGYHQANDVFNELGWLPDKTGRPTDQI